MFLHIKRFDTQYGRQDSKIKSTYIRITTV